MTIIVVSVSWLMAIISIMFGSYTHIKMFFTLCLSMVLWTPILSIINFLNDLNIQKTFELINANDATLTYANYKDVIQKVTANSNFISYLIMLTPMLAYALAKGSEMGFVSIASSLSQQLAGGARAAGGFATQQALSTSTAISSPDGSMVSSLAAGRREDVYAANVGGSVVSMSNIGTGGGMLNDSVTTAGGSVGVSNANGVITSMSLKGYSGSDISTAQKQSLTTTTNALNNIQGTSTGKDLIANFAQKVGAGATHIKGDGFDDGIGSNTGYDKEKAFADAVSTYYKVTGDMGLSTKLASLQFGGGYENRETNTTTTKDTRSESDNFQFSEKETATLMQNKEFMAALQEVDKINSTKQTQELINSANSFNSLNSFAQNWSVDSAATMVQNYMNANNCSMADAMVALEQAAATKDYTTISQYAGVADNSGLKNTLIQPTNTNHYDPNINNVKGIHNSNAGVVEDSAKTRVVTTPDGREIRQDGQIAAFYTASSISTREGAAGRSGIDFNTPKPTQVTHKATNQLESMTDTTKITQSSKNLDPALKSIVSGESKHSNTQIVKGF